MDEERKDEMLPVCNATVQSQPNNVLSTAPLLLLLSAALVPMAPN